jgi:hypothetical protein
MIDADNIERSRLSNNKDIWDAVKKGFTVIDVFDSDEVMFLMSGNDEVYRQVLAMFTFIKLPDMP